MNGFFAAIKGFFKFIFVVISIFSILYVIYQNKEKIVLFLQEHLPCCKRPAQQREFADYVE